LKKHTGTQTKWIENFDNMMGDETPRFRFSRNLCTEYLRVNDLLLDIGCGNGKFLHFLDRTRTIGIEIDMNALLIAKRNCSKSEFINGSSLNLPFRSQAFDHVSLWEVIEHVPKGTENILLNETNRVLKANASFTMSTPNNHFLSTTLDPAYFFLGHRHYSLAKLGNLLSSHGFCVKKQTIKGGLCTLISTNLFYFFKHVIKKRPSGRVYDFFSYRSSKGFEQGYNGVANCYLVAVKSRPHDNAA
jgi:ubiquinone/menaquinone biosynthesis C-methylase UbiE